MSVKGKVYLIGAGPGDPGLMTVRGRQVLREADTVIFDALAPVELLNEVKVGCELIDAGKRSGRHRLEQNEIIRLLVRASRQGKIVVRLKGGDPFVFGRGGEEGGALAKAGIPFEIIPGVSSATAVPAYAGIPLTHRDFNSSVTILTGHGGGQDSEVGPAPLDWENLAKQETLVMLMGVKSLVQNMRTLVHYGKSPQTPVSVTQWGTLPEQRTVTGTLSNIATRVRSSKVTAPSIIVVGDIVQLRDKLNWFEAKPLFGKHILVTRARKQAGELSERLRAEAAFVTEIPTISIEPPRTMRGLDQAIRNLSDFAWVIFTSVNGVDAFFARLEKLGRDARTLADARIAVIGPATAERLKKYGVRADVAADTYQAEGVLKKLPARVVRDRAVLIARAEKARAVLPEELKKRGAKVAVVSCYRAVIPGTSRSQLRRLIRANPPDLLTFASSSMVENFVKILKTDRKLWMRARKIPAACIGPITTKTAKQLGLNVVIQPKEYTIPALVEAIVKGMKRKKGNWTIDH